MAAAQFDLLQMQVLFTLAWVLAPVGWWLIATTCELLRLWFRSWLGLRFQSGGFSRLWHRLHVRALTRYVRTRNTLWLAAYRARAAIVTHRERIAYVGTRVAMHAYYYACALGAAYAVCALLAPLDTTSPSPSPYHIAPGLYAAWIAGRVAWRGWSAHVAAVARDRVELAERVAAAERSMEILQKQREVKG